MKTNGLLKIDGAGLHIAQVWGGSGRHVGLRLAGHDRGHGGEPFLWWLAHKEPPLRGDVNWASIPMQECLEPFVALYNASDDEIFRFAHQYGTLGMWPFRRPYKEAVGLEEPEVVWEGEPLRLWRRMAAALRAILLIGVSLREGKDVEDELWQEILAEDAFAELCQERAKITAGLPTRFPDILGYNGLPYNSLSGKRLDAQYQMNTLYGVVAMWVGRAQFYLDVYPEKTSENRNGSACLFGLRLSIGHARDLLNPERITGVTPGYEDLRAEWWEPFRPSALFNILIAQMAAVLTSPRQAWRCSVCGEPFFNPRRKPASDNNHTCGKRECVQEAGRRRARLSYERAKAKKAAHSA